MTIIKKCSCSHKYQDQTYGFGMRVWNLTTQKVSDKVFKYRCTVCGSTS